METSTIWEMNVEETVYEYLGVGIKDVQILKKDRKGTKKAYKVSQEGLVNKILNTTKMSDCNVKATSATLEALLGTDANYYNLEDVEENYNLILML